MIFDSCSHEHYMHQVKEQVKIHVAIFIYIATLKCL